MGRMKPGGRNFKIPSPLLASVSLGPFCAPPGASCASLENRRAPLKFCPCAVCASCDRAALDRARSLSLEFCSKFIAKFKIISLKLTSSPREIGICAVFCGANFNHTSAALATPCRLTMRVNLSACDIQSARNAIKSRCKRHRTGGAAIRRNAESGSAFSATKAESGSPVAVLKFHRSLICNFKILRNVRS